MNDGPEPDRPGGGGRGLVRVSPDAADVLVRLARRWSLAALALFGLLLATVGMPANPDGGTFGTPVAERLQLALLLVAAVAWRVALRHRATAAVLFVLAGLGLGVVAAVEYRPVVSVVVAMAFVVPGVAMWAAWQHRQGLRAVAALALGTAALLGLAWTAGARTYRAFYGPTHPQSSLSALAVDRVEWVWSGAVTTHGATVVARVPDAAAATLQVRDAVGAPTGRVRPEPSGDATVRRWAVTGLAAGRLHRYEVVVEGRADRSRGRGSFRTSPEGESVFTVAVGACARTGSNGRVFEAIRSLRPDLYVNTGDLHYGNPATDDPDLFLRLYGKVLTAPAQAALYREVPVAYVWDDHDYGGNGSDSHARSRPAARAAYRTAVPHAPLPAGPGGSIQQAFTLGRTRFVLTDTRSERTDDTMLGADQLAWLERELVTASRSHDLVVWVNPDPWVAAADPGRDDWGGYPAERRRIADVIAAAGIDNLVMLSGDAHMVAVDDGTHTDYSTSGGGGFPLLHAAALDRRGSVKGGPYSGGAYPGGGQFGTLTVDERGPGARVWLRGHTWDGDVLTSLVVAIPD